ncbi:hypothetical protein N7478_002661 [Penicillium angulare]|uniref:uncharacterized protein n=1 Tax=Penicillium angulare TaxID=116970 RepID=UPI00254049F0|nr:uncharacterized protein N7478_002661 [Penicillium angulare]KAJ5286975.1 hypothetical protein N7478_002661 [Penicillium angulare]
MPFSTTSCPTGNMKDYASDWVESDDLHGSGLSIGNYFTRQRTNNRILWGVFLFSHVKIHTKRTNESLSPGNVSKEPAVTFGMMLDRRRRSRTE